MVIYFSLIFMYNCIQLLYIKVFFLGASFAEHFYNLKRTCHTSETNRLPKYAVWKSLFFVVLLPYLKQKLDEYFENKRHQYNAYASHKVRRFCLSNHHVLTHISNN